MLKKWTEKEEKEEKNYDEDIQLIHEELEKN